MVIAFTAGAVRPTIGLNVPEVRRNALSIRNRASTEFSGRVRSLRSEI
jgi:hypothetical protein